MIMMLRSGKRSIRAPVLLLLFFSFGFVQNSFGEYPPCPAVAETTFAQKAAQWVTSFQKPYCDYLSDYSASFVKQKLASGVFSQASSASGLFKVSGRIGESDGSNALSQLSVRIKLKNPTATELASAKLRALRAGVAITAYAAGKKAFVMADRVDSTLSGFAPTSFDFASKYQTQKDAAKLAHLRGLIQSQELRLVSLTKMLDSLNERK